MQTRKVSRRQLLRGAAVLSGGALLAACAAPPPAAAPPAAAPAAAAKPTDAPAAAAMSGKLQVLHRQEYFKGLEDEFKKQTEDYIKSLGMEPDVSTVNPEVFGDFMAKMQAAVAAGNPPDLTYHGNSVAQMFDLDLAEDHSGLVSDLVKAYGDIVPKTAERNAKFEDKWWAAPHSSVIGGWFVRKDAAEAGKVDLTKFNTLQERLDGAIAMTTKDMFGWGMTVNKSGDGHGLIQTAFQAFGGRAVDDTGKKVTFNSPETVAGVKWLAAVYSDAKYKAILPPGIESWTDPSNNEAYLAGKISMTTNAPSIYAKAKKDGNPIFDKIAWMPYPTTNDGKTILGAGGNQWYTIMKGSKNVDAAKKVVMHFMDPKVFTPLSILGGGLVMPAYKNAWTDELLKADANFAILKDNMFNPSDYTGFAFPAKTNAAIDASFATGFLSAMMSDVITGKKSAEDSVKENHDKIVAIFEEKGFSQK